MQPYVLSYPRLLIYACAIAVAYGLYSIGAFDWITDHLDGFGYPSIFLVGTLYSLGFTSPFAAAYFISIAPNVHPVPAALLAAAGSTLADMTIFHFVKASFDGELQRLRNTRFFKFVHGILHHESIPEKLRWMWKWVAASIFIASPLPDEIGITIIAGVTDIEGRHMTVLSFTLNFIGILVILTLAQ